MSMSWLIYFMLLGAQILLTYRYTQENTTIKEKLAASSIFVATGIYLLVYDGNLKSPYAWLIVIGLVLSFLGDWLLKYTLFGMPGLPGIVSFAAAHILYISAYIVRQPLDRNALWLLIPWAVIILTALLVQKKIKIDFSGSGPAVFGYIIIIAAMVCLGCRAGILYMDFTDIVSIGKGLILVVGVILFMISDCGVALHMFGKKERIPLGKKSFSLDTFNLITYYSGQFLIASSILM